MWLQARMDEDFGFQVFLGPVRQRFHTRYNEAFDRITPILLEALADYSPQSIRVVAGA